MKIQRSWKSWAALALAPLLLTGCNEVSQKDVSDAREAVREEQRETEETRQQAAENVREEQRETEQTRHEALKPPARDEDLDDIREEEQETEEARQAGRENVREEKKETREAEQQASQTEAKLKAQQARDAYVAQIESKLKTADERIKQFRQQGDDLEGAAKEEHQKQVAELQTRRERFTDTLSKLKSAEALQWQDLRDDVDRAMKDLSQEIDESK